MMASSDAPTTSRIELQPQSEYPRYSTSASTANLICRLVAPQCELESTRPPVDIVTVFDVSGSMGGEKIKLAVATLKFMIANLKDTDRFGLITFDSNVYTSFELTRMDQNGKAKAAAIVAELHSGSRTNLSGGLFEGIEMMQARTDKAPVASVLLMTDGIANEGIESADELCQRMKAQMGEAPDFTTYTFGYGQDHHSRMLEMVSEIGNGMYYYIETNDIIADSFGDCLGGLLSVVGQNITLTMTATQGCTFKKVHTKKDVKLLDDGRQAVVSLGDLQSEETRDLLIEVTLPEVDAEQQKCNTHIAFKLDYINVTAQGTDTAMASLELARAVDATDDQPANELVRDAVDRNRMVDALAQARNLAEQGRLEDARAELSAMRASMAANPSTMARGYEADLTEGMNNLATHDAYEMYGAHQMISSEQMHRVQRSNRVWSDDLSRGAYVTSSRSAMRGKY
eukprot:TRINITY_DN11865_c1_g4_i4.p2 TRINITY_DN11865_c1_g4~~TRINITY_DN11865_c1_g4_i4.p2  ORF type:complete len:456 (+),score=136.13 TRINITY_DN11865_c1_g4_i4:1977-3344(+)